MSFLKDLTGLFGVAAKGLDELITSDEEAGNVSNKALEIHQQIRKDLFDFAREYMAYEREMNTAKKDLMVAEVKSASWLTRNWRPLVVVGCISLMMLDAILLSFGFSWWTGFPDEFKGHMWGTTAAIIGIYTLSRGAEKIADKIVSKKIKE